MPAFWLDAFQPGRAGWYVNAAAGLVNQSAPAVVEELMPEAEGIRARMEIQLWQGYAPTPLHRLDGIAGELGIGGLWLKDEGPRFGLGSFKALGGAYAVYQFLASLIEARGGYAGVTSAELRAGTFHEIVSQVTVATATDGNHGKSVAWGAQQFGCACKIYLHGDVSPGREAAIAAYGPEIIRVAGDYDHSVRQADTDATENGWQVISDTSYPGYREIPRDVMQGYTVMTSEVVRQLAGHVPTHVFLPGGVGGLAAAAAAAFWRAWSGQRPRFIIVEPETADCLYQSALAGQPAPSNGDLETVMAGLSAGEVSLLAWDILSEAADIFMVLADALIAPTMRRLADDGVIAGESGAAALAGLAAAASDSAARAAMGLDQNSRVLALSTEGATDPEIYQRMVGRSAEAVLTNRRP